MSFRYTLVLALFLTAATTLAATKLPVLQTKKCTTVIENATTLDFRELHIIDQNKHVQVARKNPMLPGDRQMVVLQMSGSDDGIRLIEAILLGGPPIQEYIDVCKTPSVELSTGEAFE